MMERLLEAERNLAVGLIDRAEAIYRQLAEADPRNAVAVVGLAQCALERGDERGAYDLAVRALTIDPDDAMALRMEARLSEVLATRGQAVTRPASVTDGSWALGAAPAAMDGATPAAGPGDGTAPGPGGSTASGGHGPGPGGAPPAPAARPRRGLLGRILGRG